MKKIIFILFVMMFSTTFAFDNFGEVFGRIENEYDGKNLLLKITTESNVVNFKGKRGNAIALYDEKGELESLTLTHWFKRVEDKELMRGFLANVAYFIGEPELNNSTLSQESQRIYDMEMSSSLSGRGVLTKVIDTVLISKTFGLLYNNGREQKLVIKIQKK